MRDDLTRSEMEAKLAMLRRRLGEMKEYKRLINAEGLQPDEADKKRETELIKQVLWLEKKLGGGAKAKPAGKGARKSGKKAPAKRPAKSTPPPKKKSKIRSKQKKKAARG